MSYLLDTSAIINIVQQEGKEAVAILRDQYTLDLAYYDCGNVIRTLVHRKGITRAEALQLAADIAGAWSLMRVVAFALDEMQAVLTMALDKDVAYYDAAFLYQAKKLNATLVTDDQPFQKRIPADIRWMDSSRLISSNE
jgi:predicted nucleic acid-binding protein